MFDWRMHFKLGPARKWNDIIHKLHTCVAVKTQLSFSLQIALFHTTPRTYIAERRIGPLLRHKQR
jgi:hypothetical protein